MSRETLAVGAQRKAHERKQIWWLPANQEAKPQEKNNPVGTRISNIWPPELCKMYFCF
jgi:hypothetical protein